MLFSDIKLIDYNKKFNIFLSRDDSMDKKPLGTNINLKKIVTEEYVQVRSINLKLRKGKFTSGGNIFPAKILDENFLAYVDTLNGDFKKSNVLKVKLELQQYIDKSGIIRSEQTIIKVLNYEKDYQQDAQQFIDSK